ncbi:hypothetical protein GQ54DRAFT_297321 [Martensiomyces pterosporus]|nr:hypothetical protein GQ54DRAFT_297321 [Martensiomyces pterosporus]
MSDLFGSDVSDDERKSPLSSPRTPTSHRDASPHAGDSGAEHRGGSSRRSSPAPSPNDDGDGGSGNDDLFGSGDEDERASRSKPSAESGDALGDLFGSDDEDGDVRSDTHRGDRDSLSDRDDYDVDVRVRDEDDGEERETSKLEVRVLTARVPVLPAPCSSEGKYIIARTPNILQLDPTPFSAQSYEDIIAEEHKAVSTHGYASAVSPELASAVEGIISNTVRWRRVRGGDGSVKRESNARLVRWSDGSTTVVIGGNKPEHYNVSADMLVGSENSKKPDQHHYAAVHHPHELLMLSQARLTEQWSLRPSKQSKQTRHAVSLLLSRVRSSNAGDSASFGFGFDRFGGAKTGRTRFMVADEDPELIAKREEEEEERREKQRRKEEKQRERREARDQRPAHEADGYNNTTSYAAGDYSEDDREYDYESGDAAGEAGAGYERQRPAQREAGRFGVPQFGRRPRNAYMDEEEDDGFVVDDDAELEVGPRDEFDEEEEEEERFASRLNSAKRATYADDDDSADGGRDSQGARNAKSRRLMVSDDDDDDE